MNHLDLQSREIASGIYLLKGDSYLCKQTQEIIKDKLQVGEFGISFFDEENFDAINILNACNQFSFFDEKRLVVVKALSKELNSKDKDMFLAYAKNQNANCVLLLVDDFDSKCFDFLKKAEVVDCKANENFLLNHIKSSFEKFGKVADIEVCKYLCSCCLSNLTKINVEVKKICDYLGSGNIVDKQTIDLLVAKDTETKVFDLTDALGNKNKDKAITYVYQMLESGEPVIKILGLINGQFRRLMFAKINKGSNQDLAKTLGCKEYAITKAKEQANKFGAKQLKAIVNLLMETDYNIKSGAMSQENALYYLILKIINS
ncbi:MAG: DNA polymerase III subunit delta [Clostridiales bacterium]|nr:DNA polymerase III subunit delta [Clostridiales bacterium]